MQPTQEKKWYSKKRYLLPILAISGLTFLGNVGSSTQQSNVVVPIQTKQEVSTEPSTGIQQTNTSNTLTSPKPATVQAPQKQTYTSNGLSNDNYYTNVDGNQVHSPAYSDSAPAGATAQCRDGSYSFSQHRSGTCSRHGGVAKWL